MRALTFAVFVGAVTPIISNEAYLQGIILRVPLPVGLASHVDSHNTESSNSVWSVMEYISIRHRSPDIREFLPTLNQDKFVSWDIAELRFDDPVRGYHRGNPTSYIRKYKVVGQQIVPQIIVYMYGQIPSWCVPAVDPSGMNAPEITSCSLREMRNPAEAVVMHIGPISGDHCQFSNIGAVLGGQRSVLSGKGCDFGVAKTFAHKLQLPKEQCGLTESNRRQDGGRNDKPERESSDGIFGRTPPQSFKRIITMGAIIGFAVGGTYVAILLILAWRWTKPRLNRERHIKKDGNHG